MAYPSVDLTGMYHPTLGADRAIKVPVRVVDHYEARGWVLVGAGPTPPRQAVVVVHGDQADLPRPVTTGPVIWYGTVPPANADDSLDVFEPVQPDTNGETT